MTASEIWEGSVFALAEGKIRSGGGDSGVGGFGINKAFLGDVEEVKVTISLFGLCKSLTSDFSQFLCDWASSVGSGEGNTEEQ